jgi:alanine racemase
MPAALQLDTGLNRLGFAAAELDRAPPAPVLVLSHLACADTPAHPLNARQQAAFAGHKARFPAARASLAATGGALLGPAFHFDLVRAGVGLYGGLPFAGARPVVTLELPVLQLRDLAPGESVGYGADWTATRPTRVAILGAGYADGLPRALAGSGLAARAGVARCPILGRLSMDLLAVDATDLAAVPATMTLLDAAQGVDALAAAAGTTGYEILTRLGARLERVYLAPGRSDGPDA